MIPWTDNTRPFPDALHPEVIGAFRDGEYVTLFMDTTRGWAMFKGLARSPRAEVAEVLRQPIRDADGDLADINKGWTHAVVVRMQDSALPDDWPDQKFVGLHVTLAAAQGTLPAGRA